MLEEIKLALRYKNSLFDEEIKLYIEACKKNLLLAGINEEKLDDADGNITNTVIAYVKWFLNFQGQGEKWEKIYKDLKLSLVLDSRYK